MRSGARIPVCPLSSSGDANMCMVVLTVTKSFELVLLPLASTPLPPDPLQCPSKRLQVSEYLICDLAIGYQRLHDVLHRAFG